MIRRRRASLALVLALLAVQGCAALRGRSPEDRMITVELPVSRTEAVRRMQEAFRLQGYTVRETLTSGSEPVTEPFRHDGAEAVFRAEITGDARRATVVLTGTYRRVRLGGLLKGDEEEVWNSDDPLEKELWNRLGNLALTLRRVGQG